MTENLTLREKVFINFSKFKLELRLMYLIDKDFRNYIIALKYCIWLSLIWLVLDTTIRIVGYYQ